MTDLSRRKTFAAIGGVVSIPATQAFARTAPSAGMAAANTTCSLGLHPSSFGAPLDGVQSDSASFQRVLDLFVTRKPIGGVIALESGSVLLTSPIHLPHYTTLNFGRADVTLRPDKSYAIGIGDFALASSVTLSGDLLQLYGKDRAAVFVRNGAGFQLLGCGIDLRDAGQTGLQVDANDDPMGPYNGVVSGLRINGQGLPGQTGVLLRQKQATGSIGVNRWIFDNLRHLASLEVGMDIQGAVGLTVSNANFESCHGSAIRLGDGARAVRGRVSKPVGAGGFAARELSGMSLDPVGAIEMLSGPNRGLSMIVTTITSDGSAIFPLAFPHAFSVGDEFVFHECKVSSIDMRNVTYEGGGRDTEVAVDFRAGARDCRVELAMITMARGYYFRRAIEDASNTIARTTDMVRFTVTLDPAAGVYYWPPRDSATGGSWLSIRGPSWVDAIYLNADQPINGYVDAEVMTDAGPDGLVATLTSTSPSQTRRIRRELPANTLLGIGRRFCVKLTKPVTHLPVKVTVEVAMGCL